MTPFDKQPLFLVQEVRWELDESCADLHNRWLCPDVWQGRPVVAFTSNEAALEEALRLDREVRADRNPFCYGEEMEDRTDMPEGVFRDWLADQGIDPPGAYDDWASWWVRSRLTAEQRETIWDVLDGVCFFVVVELPPT